MPPSLPDLAQALLEAARKAGAEAADALAVGGTSLSIDIRQGRLETAERAEGTEVGLRVLIGRRQACVSASDTSAATLAALAERAVAMAREAPEDPTAGLAEAAQVARGWDLRRWIWRMAAKTRGRRGWRPRPARWRRRRCSPGSCRPRLRPAFRAGRCSWRNRTGSRAATGARRIRGRWWPSAAAARRWSGTGRARGGPMPPICRGPRASAGWRPNARWRGWAR